MEGEGGGGGGGGGGRRQAAAATTDISSAGPPTTAADPRKLPDICTNSIFDFPDQTFHSSSTHFFDEVRTNSDLMLIEHCSRFGFELGGTHECHVEIHE